MIPCVLSTFRLHPSAFLPIFSASDDSSGSAGVVRCGADAGCVSRGGLAAAIEGLEGGGADVGRAVGGESGRAAAGVGAALVVVEGGSDASGSVGVLRACVAATSRCIAGVGVP